MKSASIRWRSANAPSCGGMITASMVSIPEDGDPAGSGSPSGWTTSVDEFCALGSAVKDVVVVCGVSGQPEWSGAAGDGYSSADLEGVLATTCKDDKKNKMTCIGRLGRKCRARP